MRIRTLQVIIYGAFILGAVIAFAAVAIPSLSDFLTLFTYIGGIIVLCGIVSSVLLLRIPVCPDCREFNCRCSQ